MLEFTNQNQVLRSLKKLSPRYQRAARKGLRRTAERVLNTGRANAPIEDGELRDKSEIVEDKATGEVSVEFFAPHALIVHEDPTLAHETGGDKYLARAVETHQKDISKDIHREWERL